MPSNGSKLAAADVFPVLPTRTLSPKTVYKGPSWMLLRRERKRATWILSSLVRGFGLGGLYV